MQATKQTDIEIKYSPRPWQKKCHKKLKRFTVLALHRRAGKTELALMQLINSALKFDKDQGFFCYVAPFLSQSKSIAWARLKLKLEPLRLLDAIIINESELSIKFKHNLSMIRLFGADNPNAMRGLRIDGVVIDEVAQCKPEIWSDVLQPATSDRHGWAVFIGTPNGVNLFSELFQKSLTLEDWYGAKYTVYDTNSLDSKEVDRLKRDMSEVAFAREYLCDFDASAEDQLISLSDAITASRREYVDKDIESAPRILGVDPARFGDDRSVICKRQGLVCFEPLIYRGIDNMDLAGRVASVIEAWQPDAVFVDAGAGSGVIDRLRQLDYDPIEVPFGGRAVMDKQFANRRMEMWWLMREWIEGGGAIPDCANLKQELATPIFWYDASGRKVLESKDDIKKRLQGGGSPDIADALCLTFAYPVSKRVPYDIATRLRKRTHHEYDPYAPEFQK